MPETFASRHADAFRKLGIGTREKPAEIFPKFTKQDFQTLKDDYNRQFGYTIRIPQWDDIVHLVPNALKSEAQIKAEKKQALVRILESPAPEWGRKYSSVMTWIDDVQDTSSVAYPLLAKLGRIAPKVFTKIIPLIGWIGTAYDLLNIANAFGRAPLSPMKAKRESCKMWRRNPFSKTARLQRVGNIKNYKMGMADAIQIAQVSDQFLGFGLSLGGIMGAITDSIFGAYRYATGQPVRFSFDPPDVSTLGLLGSRGLSAAAAISSQGQVFTEEQHFWTYMTTLMSSMAYSGEFMDNNLGELVLEPEGMLLPAPSPRDPLTISVIEDAGLRVDDGVGWPWNGEKFISVGDYIDATADSARINFLNYANRHSRDSYGYLSAVAMDYLMSHVFLAIDPDAEYFQDDTLEMKIFWRMIKAPLLPSKPVTKEKAEQFFGWVRDFYSEYGKEPGIWEIQQKFYMMGISYKTSYPATPDPDFEEFFPRGWTGDDVF
jgi:hypothetical protein